MTELPIEHERTFFPPAERGPELFAFALKCRDFVAVSGADAEPDRERTGGDAGQEGKEIQGGNIQEFREKATGGKTEEPHARGKCGSRKEV